MDRTYGTDTVQNPTFFIGKEVEHTPAHGQLTLFVVGTPEYEDILQQIKNNEQITHVFFGANHSFPDNPNGVELHIWESMIRHFLMRNILCTLDIPYSASEKIITSTRPLCAWENFIPLIRISLKSVQNWNYNATIKLDDVGFDQTNPGVWCHRLHNLKSPDVFTAWREYAGDTPISKTINK